MQAEGALNTFERWEDTRRAKYVKYLGVGDGRGYQKIVSAQPHGDGTETDKLECTGHMHKKWASDWDISYET
jgi:hypothetical protein